MLNRIEFFSALTCVMLLAVIASDRPATAQVTNRNNLGTEFYVAFFPNEGGEQGFETKNTTDLYLTSRVPASGEVDVPALNFYQTFTTTPGQITTIVLPNGNQNSPSVLLLESSDEQVTHGMAVHIKSNDNPIAVFGMNHKLWSSDAFMGLPVNVLGTEYRTMNYPTSDATGMFRDGDTPGEFVIVAVQDSTNVTLTLRDVSSRGTPANTLQNIRMNTGDVYLVQGDPGQDANDLTGSLIESDHPIAVLSGHKRTQIPDGALDADGSPSRDLLVEQLPPVSAWGDSALVVPYATSPLPDLVRVVCAEDGTQITVNGTPVNQTFNAGDFYEITQLQGVTSIQASKPIEVGQYMHTCKGNQQNGNGDPALALVFPVEQYDTAYTIISIENDAFTNNFVNIVADASYINTMRLDGNPIPASEFHPIPNTRFDYAQHQLVQGTHNIYGAKPFGTTVYALGPVDSYAYTGGTSLKTITPLKTVGLSIDFGDRVLGPGPTFAGTFDTTVILQNVSEDTVNIYSFPKRISDTDRFNVDSVSIGGGPSVAVSKGLPLTLPPLTAGTFTISFHPHEINRRMHTQITASTDHLRAYVVDVYGRGVQDSMGVFRDTNKIFKIDTIDFGTFTNADAPADSEVYVGNAGTTVMTISSIPGPSNPYFTQTGVVYQGTIQPLPFTIAEPPSGAARVGLRFLPFGLGNGRYLDSITITSQTSIHKVYLVGHVETITALSTSVDSVAWGTTLVCDDSSFNIPVNNPNDLPVTITSAGIVGTDKSDFVFSTRTPLVIPARQTVNVQVHFLPIGRGVKNADVILNFDLPKNAKPDTVPLAGTGDKLTLELAAQQNVHSYALDPFFLVPIYAKTDLTPWAADGYEIHVYYNSIHLKLIDIVTNGTLTPQGYPSLIQSSPPGRDTVVFAQGSGGDGPGSNTSTPISGGGPAAAGASANFPDGLPLIYLKFQTLLAGADPQTFQEGFPITFDVIFNDAVIPSGCADHIYDSGYAVVDPSCGTQYLETQPAFPSAMMLGQPTPNPTNAAITVQYDVATEGPVTIDAVDAQGTIVATLVHDSRKPGYYSASLDANALPSGAYLLRMAAANYQSAKKFVIQR